MNDKTAHFANVMSEANQTDCRIFHGFDCELLHTIIKKGWIALKSTQTILNIQTAIRSTPFECISAVDLSNGYVIVFTRTCDNG